MTARPTISFAKIATPKKASVVLFSTEDGGLSDAGKACDPAKILEKAFSIADFTGKSGTSIDLIAPEGIGFDRLLTVGAGKSTAMDEYAWFNSAERRLPSFASRLE